jgi:hypothetical protein
MTRVKAVRRLVVRLTLLSIAALGVSVSTSVLSGEAPDLDADMQRHTDAVPVSPSSDSPAAPASVVIKSSEPPPAATGHAPSANPLWTIPLATLSNTRERPIFSASRRPPPPTVALATAPKAPPRPKPASAGRPQLALVGTIVSDDQGFGIFVDQSTKSALRLKIGEDFQGWKLQSVHGRQATLERDQETATLNLPEPGTRAAGPLPVQAENVVAAIPAEPPPRDGGGRH